MQTPGLQCRRWLQHAGHIRKSADPLPAATVVSYDETPPRFAWAQTVSCIAINLAILICSLELQLFFSVLTASLHACKWKSTSLTICWAVFTFSPALILLRADHQHHIKTIIMLWQSATWSAKWAAVLCFSLCRGLCHWSDPSRITQIGRPVFRKRNISVLQA